MINENAASLGQAAPDALEEKKKLQKHFGRFDVLFFLICTLVGVDTIGSVAKSGAQGFTWLAFLAVAFFVICTLVGVDTIGSVAKSGAQGFTWLAFLAVAFFVICTLVGVDTIGSVAKS